MSATHFSRRMPHDPTRFVLVAPRVADVLERPEAAAMASGAADVLAGARVVATLAEALDGITRACATSARALP